MDAIRFRRAKDSPSKTLAKSETHRKWAKSGSPFLSTLSFGDAKESVSAVGPTNRQEGRFAYVVSIWAKYTDVFRETDL